MEKLQNLETVSMEQIKNLRFKAIIIYTEDNEFHIIESDYFIGKARCKLWLDKTKEILEECEQMKFCTAHIETKFQEKIY